MKLPTKKNIQEWLKNYVGNVVLPATYAVMCDCMDKSPSAPTFEEYERQVLEQMKPKE